MFFGVFVFTIGHMKLEKYFQYLERGQNDLQKGMIETGLYSTTYYSRLV